LQYFTLIHIAISIAGIASGFGFLAGLVAGRLFPGWAVVFLAATIATSVTGFFFPFHGVTPGIVVGRRFPSRAGGGVLRPLRPAAQRSVA
jgi:hypothetical protein